MVKLPFGLGDLPKRYPSSPKKYIPGKTYWGYEYFHSDPYSDHLFKAKGRPAIRFTSETIGTGYGREPDKYVSPPYVLSVVSKYPKKLLAGLGEIRSGGNQIHVSFGQENAQYIGGLYTPKSGDKLATIDLAHTQESNPVRPETLAHEIAHHIDETHNEHKPILWHLPNVRNVKNKNIIGGPTEHADRNPEEDFAETVSIIQTEGKKGLDEAYQRKWFSHNLDKFSEGSGANVFIKSKAELARDKYDYEAAKESRKKLFDFVAGRYGVPKRVKASDPSIPKAYRAPEQLVEEDQRLNPIYHLTLDVTSKPHYPTVLPMGTTTLATAGYNAQANKPKVPIREVPAALRPKEEIEITERPGEVKPWSGPQKLNIVEHKEIEGVEKMPVNILYTSTGKEVSPIAGNLSIAQRYIGGVQGVLVYDPKGKYVHWIGADPRAQKGIGTTLVGELLEREQKVGLSSVEGATKFWKKMGAKTKPGHMSSTLEREDYEVEQIRKSDLGEPGTPLYPKLKGKELEEARAVLQPKQESPLPPELVSEPTEELVFQEKPRYEYRESPLVPKRTGYDVPTEYEINEKEGAIMPRERPKDLGVAFEAQPEGPSRATSESSDDMFMTKEGRKLAKEYAGTEEEIDEELKSLYGDEVK